MGMPLTLSNPYTNLSGIESGFPRPTREIVETDPSVVGNVTVCSLSPPLFQRVSRFAGWMPVRPPVRADPWELPRRMYTGPRNNLIVYENYLRII